MDKKNVVEGILKEIIYDNENNGYRVCSVVVDEDETIFVGILAGISPGENIKAVGEWKVHNIYGDQFVVDTFEKTMPKTEKAIERYLSSGVIKGIGPTIAKRIVKKFGEKTLEIIENQAELLEQIKGISLNKAQEIGETYQIQRELRDAILFLGEFGISPTYAIKIYKKYKDKTIDIVKTNPYKLADDIHGVGFKKADAIASTMGMRNDSEQRIMSGIKYVLTQATQNGDTYLPKEILEKYTISLLNIPIELIENALLELQMSKQIFQEKKEEEIRIYLSVYYNAELFVAKQLIEIAETEEEEEKNIDEEINEIEKEKSITLANNQREAVKESLKNGVLVITGGPGTGKTTTINAIITILEKKELEILLAAPTGRAAKRMTETTNRQALTIHRLLEISFMGQGNFAQEFGKNEENPLEADVIIIDEVSMVDIMLMKSLVKALMPGTRLILVGDVDQLPSVGPGNVLNDIINSNEIKVVKLNEIFRQARESAIVMNAHRINNGEVPILNEKGKDFFFIRKGSQDEVIKTILELTKTRLPKFAKCSPIKDIQILTPMRKSPLGVNSLNAYLQDELNPPSKNKNEKEFRDTLFREGDKVMQIKNNYNISWKILNKYDYPLDEGVGIFNGDTGIITEINNRLEKITIKFDDNKVVEYDYTNLEELDLAYAITIHKSQGSEYQVVILPIHSGPPMLLSRNLLYTAVTRAKKLVVVVGLEDTIKRMIDNKREINRYSSLKDRIQELRHIQEIN